MAKIYVKSTSNLALIKYWGVLPDHISEPLGLKNHPTKSSLSLTTDNLMTITGLSINRREQDQPLIEEFRLNGKLYNENSKEYKNIYTYLERVSAIYPSIMHYSYKLESVNTFPTAAGLASSASGFSALALALAHLIPEIKQDLESSGNWERKLTIMARQLSGSACRSIPKAGGLVIWHRGFNIEQLNQKKIDKDSSYAESLIPASELKDIKIILPLIKVDEKPLDSRSGMRRSVETAPLYWHWVEYEENVLLPRLLEAFKIRDYHKIWEIVIRASDGLHSIMLNSYPKIVYMNDSSHNIANMILDLNNKLGKNVAAYSFDAGPNPLIFTTQDYLDRVLELVESVGKYIVSNVGEGAKMIDEEYAKKYL